MRRLRFLMALRRGWFVVLLACTLAVRLLVPMGFMPVTAGGVLAFRPCPGTAAPRPAASMAHMAPGEHHEEPAKAEMPCAFAGIGLAALGSAAAPLLAVVLAFSIPAPRRFVRQILPTLARLRPPLRAPPGLA